MIGVVILAGGQGRRMGGQDKGWCQLAGKAFIEIVLEKLERQVSLLNQPVQIVISANRNIEQYRQFGVPVISDLRDGFQGPLAGVETALNYGLKHDISIWITCPIDCLQLPDDYLQKMSRNLSEKIVVWAQNGRQHFSHMRLTTKSFTVLQDYLSDQNSIKGFLYQQGHNQQFASDSIESDNWLFNVNGIEALQV
ncbi:molybdenum cofactor guanylyltransferase [uncultured Thiomicrorhabdus sp.]|jgi:molybdopterin-guanine dinucleotide biosynthesis protein A